MPFTVATNPNGSTGTVSSLTTHNSKNKGTNIVIPSDWQAQAQQYQEQQYEQLQQFHRPFSQPNYFEYSISLPQQWQHSSLPQQYQLPDLSNPNFLYQLPPTLTTDIDAINLNWLKKEQELIKHFTKNINQMIGIYERTKPIYTDYLFTLIPRFEFLKFAVISIASLHVDYIANPADFHASELSMRLFNLALSKTSAACNEITEDNFEALFFATSFIMISSYRLTNHIPMYSNGPEQVDILSLSKGPVFILMSMKEHIINSPLITEFAHNAYAFERQVETKMCDNLLQVCSILSDDGELEQDLKSLLDVLRRGPASPPADEAVCMDKRSLARSRGGSNASFSSMESSSSTNSLAKGNPFLTKESIMYLKMNPMDQNYIPEPGSTCNTTQASPEDFYDGLESPIESEAEYDNDDDNTRNSNSKAGTQQTSNIHKVSSTYSDFSSNSKADTAASTTTTGSPSKTTPIDHKKQKNPTMDFGARKRQYMAQQMKSQSKSSLNNNDSIKEVSLPLSNNHDGFAEALTILRITARKVVSIGNFSRIHVWSMLLNREFLTLLRVKRHPFALIMLCYYLCMMIFDDFKFWLQDRLFKEIREILYGNAIPAEWTPLLDWPKMVLEMAEKCAQGGTNKSLGLEMFQKMINYPV